MNDDLWTKRFAPCNQKAYFDRGAESDQSVCGIYTKSDSNGLVVNDPFSWTDFVAKADCSCGGSGIDEDTDDDTCRIDYSEVHAKKFPRKIKRVTIK